MIAEDLPLPQLIQHLVAAAMSQEDPRAQAVRALERLTKWQPMDTAPKGSQDIEDTRDPAYVKPPLILLRFGTQGMTIASWDAYYAPGGAGEHKRDGCGWIIRPTGEPINMHYSAEPDGWMHLPDPA